MIQQQKIELASEIPEEPEASDPTAVRVLIKLPGGQVRGFKICFIAQDNLISTEAGEKVPDVALLETHLLLCLLPS